MNQIINKSEITGQLEQSNNVANSVDSQAINQNIIPNKTPISRDDFKKLVRIVHSLINSPESVEFRKPVYYKALGLDDYKKIVKKPMDLNTVRRTLNKNLYKNIEDFLDEIQLIWNNCKLYNEKDSWIYNKAIIMEKYFREVTLTYFPDIPLPSTEVVYPKNINEIRKQQQQAKINKEEIKEETTEVQANANKQQQQQTQIDQRQHQEQMQQSQQPKKPTKDPSKKFIKKTNKNTDQKKEKPSKQKQGSSKEHKLIQSLPFQELLDLTQQVQQQKEPIIKQIVEIIKAYCPQIVKESQRGLFSIQFHMISQEAYRKIIEYILLQKQNQQQQIEQQMEEESNQYLE